MTDIVDRLRRGFEYALNGDPTVSEGTLEEAADEIERLRADLIAANSKWSGDVHTLSAVINEQAADVVRLIAQIDALRAAGDRLADAVMAELQPFPGDQHIALYWAQLSWREVGGDQ